jgi:hypothetical protein
MAPAGSRFADPTAPSKGNHGHAVMDVPSGNQDTAHWSLLTSHVPATRLHATMPAVLASSSRPTHIYGAPGRPLDLSDWHRLVAVRVR